MFSPVYQGTPIFRYTIFRTYVENRVKGYFIENIPFSFYALLGKKSQKHKNYKTAVIQLDSCQDKNDQ